MVKGSATARRSGVSAASPGLRVETQFSQILDEHQDLPPSPLTPLGSEDELVDLSRLLAIFRKKKKKTSRVAKFSSKSKARSRVALTTAPAPKPPQCTRCQMAGIPCVWTTGSCEGCKKLRQGCSHVGTPYKPRGVSKIQIRVAQSKAGKYPARASEKRKVGGGKTRSVKVPHVPHPSSRCLRSSKRKPDVQTTLPRRKLRPRPAPQAPVTPPRRSARVANGRTGDTQRAAHSMSRRSIRKHPVASVPVQDASKGLLTPKSIPRKRSRNDAPDNGLPTPKSMPRKRRRLGTDTHENNNSAVNAVLPLEGGTDDIDRTLAPSAALPSLLDPRDGRHPRPPAQQSTAHHDIARPVNVPADDDLAAALGGASPPNMLRVLSPPSNFSAHSETPARPAATYAEHGVANASARALPERNEPASSLLSAQHSVAMASTRAAAQEDLTIDIAADASPAGPRLPMLRALSPSASLPPTIVTLPQPEDSESSSATPPTKPFARPSTSPTAPSTKRKHDDIEDLPRLTRAQKRALMNKEAEKKQRVMIRIPPLRLSKPISSAANRPVLAHRDSSTPRKGLSRQRPSLAGADSTIRPGAEAVAVGLTFPPGADAAAVDGALPPTADARPAAVDNPTAPGKTQPPAKKRDWTAFEAVCPITTTRRPLPPGVRPLLWAQTRQEICETVPWFRTYQGGVSAKDCIPYGYLLGNFAAPRDVFAHGGRLIISHTGGGQATVEVEIGGTEGAHATKRPATAKITVLQENQGETRSQQHAALANAWKNQHPVVLLADRGYALFPFEFEADELYYALGWYWVRDMWQECEPDAKGEGHTRIKVCFQWVESQGRPWWCPGDEAAKAGGVELGGEQQPQRRRPRKVFSSEIGQQTLSSDLLFLHCARCKAPSKQVYRLDWMCLNAACVAFWTLSDGTSPRGEGFKYEPKFLALAKAPAHIAACIWDYRPQVPAVSDEDGFTTSRAFQKGFFCQKCGRVSTRSKWECWQCPKCENRFAIEWPIHSASAWQAVHGTQPWGEHKIHNPAVELQQYTIHVDDNATVACVNRFTLPNGRGEIFQILGNDATNSVAEDILKSYQSDFVEKSILKRVPLASHRLTSVMLTQYFSQNSGVPYKYVAGTDTTIPFSEAPLSVNMALNLITQRARLVAPGASFNELLTAGYLEGQMMNFHSDFEQGLGEDVAALSLGSPALMKFRANKKCGANNKDRPQLEFKLNHGDILVMHGAGIQEYYEHTVIPTGFRIAATARSIDVGRNNNETSATLRKPMKLAPVQNIESNAPIDLLEKVPVDQAVHKEGVSQNVESNASLSGMLLADQASRNEELPQNVESNLSRDVSEMVMVDQAVRNEGLSQTVEFLDAPMDLMGMVLFDQAVRNEVSTDATTVEPWDKDWQHRVWMPEVRYNLDGSTRPW